MLGPQFDVGSLIDRLRAQVEHPLSAFDAVLCIADGSCDAHAHPPQIAWRVERVEPDGTLDGERRRLAAWQRALTTASARGFEHALLLEAGTGPETMPALAQWERPWGVCLLPASPPSELPAAGSFTTAGKLAMAGLAVAVHARAFERILADLGSDDAGAREFLATWPDLDTYLLRGMAEGGPHAIGEPFAEPAVDRPIQGGGLELVELATGIAVRHGTPPREHALNNTAAMVFVMCDGERTVSRVAEELAEHFALATIPLAEVSACVDGLRRAGVLRPRALTARPRAW